MVVVTEKIKNIQKLINKNIINQTSIYHILVYYTNEKKINIPSISQCFLGNKIFLLKVEIMGVFLNIIHNKFLFFSTFSTTLL